MAGHPTGPLKSWLDRLLEFAIIITAIALLLDWAWTVIRPLVPIILIITGTGIILTMVLRRRYGAW